MTSQALTTPMRHHAAGHRQQQQRGVADVARQRGGGEVAQVSLAPPRKLAPTDEHRQREQRGNQHRRPPEQALSVFGFKGFVSS